MVCRTRSSDSNVIRLCHAWPTVPLWLVALWLLALSSIGCVVDRSRQTSGPAATERVEAAIARIGEPKTPRDLRRGLDALAALPRGTERWRLILPALYRYESPRTDTGVTLAVLSELRPTFAELLPALADLFDSKDPAARRFAAILLAAEYHDADPARTIAAFVSDRRKAGRPVAPAMIEAATTSFGH